MALGITLFLIAMALLAAVAAELKHRIRCLETEVEALRRAMASAALPQAAGTEARPQAAEPDRSDRTLANWFERLVGGRLLIWVGGIALAAGGVFLIRHSIDLVTPAARMIAATMLGLGLIGIGDYARGGRVLADDPRIGQALVGAGIAVLYATAYGSHILFGLIGSGTASLLMVAITMAALGLALRHGTPAAALGLIGGFLTPLLVGERDADALQVLAYLALLDAAILALAWRRGWTRLVGAAQAASLAWTGYFILDRPEADGIAAGAFAALLGVVAMLHRGEAARMGWSMLAVTAALVELALLVALTDTRPVAWLLFGAVAAATLALAALRPELNLAPVPALLLAILLIAIKAAARSPEAGAVAAVTTLLFAVGAVPGIVRGRMAAAMIACIGLAGPLLVLRAVWPDRFPASVYGSAALLIAVAALGLLWLIRNRGRPEPGLSGYAAAGTAALLLAVGAGDLAPRDYLSAAWLVVASGLLVSGIACSDRPLRVAGLGLLTATVVKVFLVDAAELEGVLRILSFLGLGIALIGIGLLYGKVLGRKQGPLADQASETVPRTVP